MRQTNTLIVGASISGLACAACLKKLGLEYIIIDKENTVAAPWRNHYDRLHLHTNKALSNLPYKKFDQKIPRYPSRQQVIEYMEQYQQTFNIQPVFNTEAKKIQQENDWWITQTSNEAFQSKNIIIATGPFSLPKQIDFAGIETFPGKLLHSAEYTTGKIFKGLKVLVVGFGNSACEIAIDLFEQGAFPSISVRSAVNVVPRDVVGIPILTLSLLLKNLRPATADKLNAPLLRLLVGDITKLGLKKLPYGPLEQIQKEAKAPVLDIGTIDMIRKGKIKIYDDIDHIDHSNIIFKNGQSEVFDAIVAAIGYDRSCEGLIETSPERFEDLKLPTNKQRYFGNDGLYFCGFYIAPTGQIREIAIDAKRIASSIQKQNR